MVRSWAKASRLARLGGELILGDLGDPESVRQALRGCDAVVHLAHSDQAVRHTKNLLRLCEETRIRRFVHISSMAVHGPKPGLEAANEDTAVIRRRYDEFYHTTKARVERLVQRRIRRNGFPAVILRPTIVYGPYGPFVTKVIDSARQGTIVLIDEGKWTCNAIYVDDVCDAIQAALGTERGLGKSVFITADKAMSWWDFNIEFARMVQPPPQIVSVSAEEVGRILSSRKPTLRSNVAAFARLMLTGEFHRQLATVPILKGSISWARRLVLRHSSPELVARLRRYQEGKGRPATGLGETVVDRGRLIRETYPVAISNNLAKDLMGWQPRTDFSRGAELTKTWLEFAGLLSTDV
jgi:nucleoside-diphosphate-sugar epimerase